MNLYPSNLAAKPYHDSLPYNLTFFIFFPGQLQGSDCIDFDQFFDAIFEIADIWSDSTSPAEYCTFLNNLLNNLGMNPDPDPYLNSTPPLALALPLVSQEIVRSHVQAGVVT